MNTNVKIVIGLMAILLTGMNNNQLFSQSKDKDVTIIELVQTENQFSTQKLHLSPGKYRFRVVNENVNRDLGFVIQKATDKEADVMATALPNSFTTDYIKKGEAQYTGVVILEAGEYVYSCPLNPTPHYNIFVK